LRIFNLVKNLKIKNFPLVNSITELPDIVIVKNNHKKLYEISLNFTTISIGKTNLKTVDYVFEDEKSLNEFLEEFSKKGIRQRLIEFYNRFYNLSGLEPANVNFVCYLGETTEIYKKLENILNSPYNPWVLIYGQRGVGKLTILKSILKDKLIDYFEIEEKPIGFKAKSNKGEEIILLNIDLFESELELNIAINELYKREYRIIFITDKINPPSNLSTVPSIYIPSISERNNKEKLLILEHFLRKISKDIIEIEEDFYKAYLIYPWFGNFSEIENAIKYALSLDSKVLKFENLPFHIKSQFDENYNLKVADYFSKLMVLNFKDVSYEELKFLIGQEFINIIYFLYEIFDNDIDKLIESLKIEKKSDINEIKKFLGIPSDQK
jgi:hypothetical protein